MPQPNAIAVRLCRAAWRLPCGPALERRATRACRGTSRGTVTILHGSTPRVLTIIGLRKRSIGLSTPWRPRPKEAIPREAEKFRGYRMSDDRRVVVIGSGPAGAMAAYELVRKG